MAFENFCSTFLRPLSVFNRLTHVFRISRGTSKLQTFILKCFKRYFSYRAQIIKRNVTCPPQAYLSYLAFCDSPETHSIQPWWNGEHKKNDPDIRWRLHDTLSPDAFVKELEYGDSPQRMPHTLCITREFLNALLVYFHHASLRYSLSETKKCVILIIGTSAGRLAWYLTALQQRVSSSFITF